MEYKARLPENNVNVTPTSPLKDFFVLAGGVLAVLVGIYFILGVAVDFLVPRISLEMENKLAGFLPMPDSADHPEAYQALLNISEELEQCGDVGQGVTVLFNDSELVNAFAIPGRVIVVNKGLIDKAESENGLAFVLAHELGHIENRDHLRGVGRSLVFMALSAMLLGPDNGVGKMLGKGLQLSEMKYSRLQESRADSYALPLLNCRYGHVGGATEFFSIFEEEHSTNRVTSFFSTHPMNEQRIADLNTAREKMGYHSGTLTELPVSLKNISEEERIDK